MGNLTKDFSSSEFECPCGCGESKMNAKFMAKLQVFRTVMDIPLTITKGYICNESAKYKWVDLNSTGRVIVRANLG